MSKKEKLTIILTTKGRDLFTLRWLYYSNYISLKFPIIIADGQVNPSLEEVVLEKSNFPNISYQYLKYDDTDIPSFYFKCLDAVQKVDTEYVMITDNDDFVLPSGVENDIKFLDSNKEYITSGGRIPGFDLKKNIESDLTNLLGKVKSYSNTYAARDLYRCRSFEDDSSLQRVLKELKNPISVYYHVYRTSCLEKIFREVNQHNPSFLFLEQYCMIRTMSLGKVNSSPEYISYIRQQGTSSYQGYKGDLVDEILHSSLAKDFNNMIPIVTREIERNEANMSQQEIFSVIYQAYLDAIKLHLANRVLRYRFKNLFKMKQVYVKFIKTLKKKTTIIRKNKANINILIRRLRQDGAESSRIIRQKDELKKMHEVLEGKEFYEFVQSHSASIIDKS